MVDTSRQWGRLVVRCLRAGDQESAVAILARFVEADGTVEASRNGSHKPVDVQTLLDFVKDNTEAMGFETLLKSTKERRKMLDSLKPPLRTGRIFDPFPGNHR